MDMGSEPYIVDFLWLLMMLGPVLLMLASLVVSLLSNNDSLVVSLLSNNDIPILTPTAKTQSHHRHDLSKVGKG